MQVLIIDNDIAYRNGVSMAASNKHWIPVSCGDIRTAKQIISSTLPDLIISDCLLYGETVIDLLVWMKLQRIEKGCESPKSCKFDYRTWHIWTSGGKWSRKNNTDEDIGYTSYSHIWYG